MNKKYIKIAIFIIIAIAISIVVYLSKQYFNSNYNTHNTVESNLEIYRVKMVQDQEKQKESESYVVRQEQPEVHPEVTQVIEPATPVLESKPEAIPPTKDTQPTKPVEKTPEKTPTITKTPENPKKEKIPSTTLTKPKTLEAKPNVTQTVLNKTDFQTYVIQVGAFSTKEEAEVMKHRVAKIPAVSKFKVVIEYFPAKNLHKVLVEYFENADSARTTCTELKKENVQCFATKI